MRRNSTGEESMECGVPPHKNQRTTTSILCEKVPATVMYCSGRCTVQPGTPPYTHTHLLDVQRPQIAVCQYTTLQQIHQMRQPRPSAVRGRSDCCAMSNKTLPPWPSRHNTTHGLTPPCIPITSEITQEEQRHSCITQLPSPPAIQ